MVIGVSAGSRGNGCVTAVCLRRGLTEMSTPAVRATRPAQGPAALTTRRVPTTSRGVRTPTIRPPTARHSTHPASYSNWTPSRCAVSMNPRMISSGTM